MEGSTIVALLIFGTGLELILNKVRRRKIEEEINLIGGEVINIERRNFFKGIGPFMVVGRGGVVYRIEYRIGDQVEEGWVKFGRLFGPDWRL